MISQRMELSAKLTLALCSGSADNDACEMTENGRNSSLQRLYCHLLFLAILQPKRLLQSLRQPRRVLQMHLVKTHQWLESPEERYVPSVYLSFWTSRVRSHLLSTLGCEGWTAESIELNLSTIFGQLETASFLRRFREELSTVKLLDIFHHIQPS